MEKSDLQLGGAAGGGLFEMFGVDFGHQHGMKAAVVLTGQLLVFFVKGTSGFLRGDAERGPRRLGPC